jgi:hypothetical protein
VLIVVAEIGVRRILKLFVLAAKGHGLERERLVLCVPRPPSTWTEVGVSSS